MISIENYNPIWAKDFEIVRLDLLEILGDLALRIDHIGSTSVPGLGAKDIIDIQVTVSELGSELTHRLVDAGYQWFEEITQDHIPFGVDNDPKDWVKLTFSEPPNQRRTNVHVRIRGKPNQQYALLFRDYLCAHPSSAQTIEFIKRKLASRFPDNRDAYYDIKDPVYDLIWDAAKNWAQQTGWQPS